MTLGTRFKQRLDEMGLSQLALSHRAGVSQSLLSQIANDSIAETRKLPLEDLMQSREEIAGEEYSGMERAVRAGNFCFDSLAIHIRLMINGLNGDGIPLWPVRRIPPEGKLVKMDSFADYLFKPCRDGLGLKNAYQVEHGLRAIGEEGLKALTAIKTVLPDWDKRVEKGAEKVRREREDRIPAAGVHGNGPGRGKKRVDNINSFKGGTSREYRIAQLKKAGRADLVAQVIEGTLSANAAAIQAGLAKPPKPRPSCALEWLDYVGESLKTDSRLATLTELLNALPSSEFRDVQKWLCQSKAA